MADAAMGLFARKALAERALTQLRDVYPRRTARLVASGTAALATALETARRVQGFAETDWSVALPAWGCPDLGAAAVALGAGIHLYDLDPRTLEPDLDSVRSCLQHGARSVVFVHFFGRIVDPVPVAALTEEFGVPLIEDAAQANGATLDGVPAGALAEWGVLSFGRGKGCNAGGGGALISTHAIEGVRESSAASAGDWAMLCKAAATSMLGQPRVYWLAASFPGLGLGETRYHSLAESRQVSHATLALLPHLLATVGPLAHGRREQLKRWRVLLEDAGVALPAPVSPRVLEGALRLPVMLSPADAAPLGRYGVARSYPRCLGDYAPIRAHLRNAPSCPGAEELAARLHTLPTHQYVTEADRLAVMRALSGTKR
jgi:dTDP-4-amino-4,6-dideoxygalactose transaminase